MIKVNYEKRGGPGIGRRKIEDIEEREIDKQEGEREMRKKREGRKFKRGRNGPKPPKSCIDA